MKKALMADVNTVEVTDGDHGIGERFVNILNTFDDFHVNWRSINIFLTRKLKRYK
jgi:hypothetical protein